MSKLEMLTEIRSIKERLLNDASLTITERNNLLVALIALYESAVKAKE